jgi:hypothetical protein
VNAISAGNKTFCLKLIHFFADETFTIIDEYDSAIMLVVQGCMTFGIK